MMLDWEVEIASEGGVMKGWYLERGKDATHIQPGLFGADSWQADQDLVLLIGIPLSQGTIDIDWLTSAVRADHFATDADAEPSSFLTRPAPDPDPAKPVTDEPAAFYRLKLSTP